MPITIKNSAQISSMRKAGAIVGGSFAAVRPYIKPGVTTLELDRIIEEYIRSKNAIPSFLNYDSFPASACISVNEEVIHGIPGIRKLEAGDIVSIDVGALIEGYHGDAARTFPVGSISEEDAKLIEVTEQCFFKGIEYALADNHINQISIAVQKHAEENGFSVVRDYAGHGIGTALHEAPQILNYRQQSRGARMQAGMTLAIEPMINRGTYEVKRLSDNWTVVTRDGKKSAHYENTIVVTDGKPEILTL